MEYKVMLQLKLIFLWAFLILNQSVVLASSEKPCRGLLQSPQTPQTDITPKITISAVALVSLPDGRRLVLLRSATDPSFPGYWSLPGGKVEAHETPEEGLLRELKEETGLVEPIVRKLGVEEFFTERLNRRYIVHSYLVESSNEAVTLSSEHSDFRWLRPEQAIQLEPMGEFTKKWLQELKY